MKTQTAPIISLVLLTLIAPAIVPAYTFAQDSGGVTLTPGGKLVSGQSEFRKYCAQCHGLSGKGDGPVARELKTPPADLTVLAKKNNGHFPYDNVVKTINGEDVVAAHGTREMPIWGQQLANTRPSNSQAGETPQTVNQKIKRIVGYIESIQEK